MPLLPPMCATGSYQYIKNIFIVYYDAAVLETFRFFRESSETITACVVFYFTACVIVYWLSAYIKMCPCFPNLEMGNRVLIVTAHPDDECMFFGPLIRKLINKGNCNIYLVCLSKGDHENQGNIRKEELWESCRILGIPDSNITVISSTHFPDDPNMYWREDTLSTLVLRHIEMLSIDSVITFDRDGISKHKNHRSLFYAVALLSLHGKMPPYCRSYALESTSILRKYSSFLDAPLSYITSPYWFIVTFNERKVIKRAMEAHSSQLVWFRKLYVLFSRYLYINTIREIEVLDLELDLEVKDE